VTSAVGKDDIDDALFRAGIKSVLVRQNILRLVELYARKFQVQEPAEFRPPDMTGYKYLCRDCGERKVIGEFPEYKRINRRSPVPCNSCMSAKEKRK
jgi:hypothetical protein